MKSQASRDQRAGTERTAPVETRLKQAASLEVEHIDASRKLDQVEGKLQQANFPPLIHPLDDGAGAPLGLGNLLAYSLEHRFQALVDEDLGKIAFPDLKTILQESNIASLEH